MPQAVLAMRIRPPVCLWCWLCW